MSRMNYLFEAAMHLGIYYTPQHVLALGYGDGKTLTGGTRTRNDFAAVAGNPPFTAHKRIRRRIFVRCTNCGGSGYLTGSRGHVRCPECEGTGEVEKWITEIVNDE